MAQTQTDSNPEDPVRFNETKTVRYGVGDFSKHLLMGHSIGGDLENAVYARRTLNELRAKLHTFPFTGLIYQKAPLPFRPGVFF